MEQTNAADLDKLIQSFEYENQQYVKCIERENQHIEALEQEIKVRTTQTEKLQDDISQLDEDTKRSHKQFIHNRDNVGSLKKTTIVLKDHEIALEKTLKNLIEKGIETRKERTGLLQHYKDIWQDYEAKYKSFPLAKLLEEKKERVKILQSQFQTAEQNVKALQKQINEFNSNHDVDFRDMKKLIIKVVELKTGTESIIRDIKSAYKEKKSIGEEIIQAERKQKITEEEKARRRELEKSTESMEIEQSTDNENIDTSTLISMVKDAEEDECCSNKATHFTEQTGVLSPPKQKSVDEQKQFSFEEQFARLNQEITQPRHTTLVSSQTSQAFETCHSMIQMSRKEPQGPHQNSVLVTCAEQTGKVSRSPVVSVPQIPEVRAPHIMRPPQVSPRSRMAAPQITPVNRSFMPRVSPQTTQRMPLPHINRMNVPVITPQYNNRPVRPPTPQVTKYRPHALHAPFEIPKALQVEIPTCPTIRVTKPSSSVAVTSGISTEPGGIMNKSTQQLSEKVSRETTHQVVPMTCEMEQNTGTIDNQPKSPHVPSLSPQTPKTPEAMSLENEIGDFSPFDIEKHKKRIQMLKKSPGDKLMERRPMYSAEKTDTSKDQGSGVFTGITSLSLFDNPTSRNNNTEFSGLASELAMFTSSAGSETHTSTSYFESSDGGREKTSFFNMKSPDLDSPSTGFSFGGGGGDNTGGSSIMELFGGNSSENNTQEGGGKSGGIMSLFGGSESQGGGDSTQEGSFMSFFGSSTSDNQSQDKSGGNSIMSLFGGNTSENETHETSFSFSFGGSSNGDTTSRGFSLF